MKKKEQPLPEETIEALIKLGGILRNIASRMISEGKAEIKNGKLIIFKQDVNTKTSKRKSSK